MVLVNIMSADYGASEICFQKSIPSPPSRTLRPAAVAIAADTICILCLDGELGLNKDKSLSY
jgi:hypothetical protein